MTGDGASDPNGGDPPAADSTAGDQTAGDSTAHELPDERAMLPEGVHLRKATQGDRLDVARVLDGAMLRTEDVPERLASEDVLVAVAERGDGSADEQPAESVVGAAVLETVGGDRHLEAVAVRRARRGRGIGSSLVASAVRDAREWTDASRVTAEFDADLRAFYEDLGFDTEPIGSSGADDAAPARLRGTFRL